MKKELLRISNGTKKTGSLTVLKDFNLSVHEGEIVMILGGNMLEMRTVFDIITGETDLSSGQIHVQGKSVSRNGSMRGWKHKTVDMEFYNLMVDNLSITDNFFLCTDHKVPFFARDKQNRQVLQALLREFSVEIDPDQPVESLRLLQRAQLLLLKQYYYNPEKPVVLEQRTQLMSEAEVTELLDLMNHLKQRGMTFLMLDYSAGNFLREKERFDRVVVISGAITAFQKEVRFITEEETAFLKKEEWLTVQQELDPAPDEETVVLELKDVTTQALDGVNYRIRRGEISVISYAGYEPGEEMYKLLIGETGYESGSLLIDEKPSRAMTRYARTEEGVWGIRAFQEDADLLPNITLPDNLGLPRGLKIGEIWYHPRYRRYLARAVEALCGEGSAKKTLKELSPQEKITVRLQAIKMAKPKVIVCLNLLSSVDEQLRESLVEQFVALAKSGCAIILLSHLKEVRQKKQYTQWKLGIDGKLLKTE